MRYIDLFAGVGGFSLGIKQAYLKSQSTEGKPKERRDRPTIKQGALFYDRHNTPLCVGYYEWDKYAVQTYNKNFGTNYKPTDITKLRTKDIPEFDLLCAGFPCQAFSIAGKRRGFEDTRGTMFFEIVRILKAKRPKLVLLENVKGLLNHEKGKTFTTIIQTLEELGYDTQWMVLNSKFFGVPQNRERVFIIGSLRGTSKPKVLPFREGNEISKEGSQERKVKNQSSAITKNYHKGVHSGGETYIRTPLKFTSRNQKNIEGDYAFTVDSANTGGIKQDAQIRRLTPIECERLQGFPDNWSEGVSDTQRYKQMGNAVTVNVIEEIIKQMLLQPCSLSVVY